MSEFDPSGTASYEAGLFGIPSERAAARIVVIPVPWDATTSYGGGASQGPLAVWKASAQVDLFDLDLGLAYEKGYHLREIPTELEELNGRLRPLALQVRERLERHGQLDVATQALLAEVNAGCARMSEWVHQEASSALRHGQIPAVLGGDHSTPEGNIRAVSEFTKGAFGILHFDAHADLREHYQGFTRSHASIMHNVMHSNWRPQKLVQVGIRDFCEEEFTLSRQRPDIETFYDVHLKRELFEGRTWDQICKNIVSRLPQKVYVSFDIDALSPEFCPNTGTPVPGGLSYDQAVHLLRAAVLSGRVIVGFDLNEVSPGAGESEWDGNVGARLLFKLCGWSVTSQPQD